MAQFPLLASFRIRLTAGVVLLNLFVILLAGISAQHAYRQYQASAEISTQNLAQLLESRIVESFRRIDIGLLDVLDEYEREHAAGKVGRETINAKIELVRARLPEVDALRITDAQGILIYGNGVAPDARISLADRPQFVQLRNDAKAGLVFSKPQVSRVDNRWVIALARRINLPDGTFGGMIFAAVTLDHINRLFAALDLGPGGALILRDEDLGLIARHPDYQQVGLSIGSLPVSKEVRQIHASGNLAATFYTSLASGNYARTVTFRKLGEYPFYLTVGLALTDYLAGWRSDTAILVALVALFCLATACAAWLLYRAWRRERESSAELVRQESQYHELVENTSLLVVRFLPDTTILFVNAAYANFFGKAPDELLGKHWLDLIPDEQEKLLAQARLGALTPLQPSSSLGEHPIQDKNGHVRWTRWTDRAFFNKKGELTHLQSVGEDTTEHKRVEGIQKARLRLMEYAANHSLKELLVATLDEAGALTASPIGFYHFLDADQKTLSLQAWSTRTTREFCTAAGEGSHYNIDLAGVWVEAVRLRRPVIHNDYAALSNKRGLPPGHAQVLREMVVPVFRKGMIVAILGVGNKATPYVEYDMETVSKLADLAWDIAESKRLEAELLEMATTDFLTGLFNRRHFSARMDETLARLKRHDTQCASVLMLDLDHFKNINDSFGHAAGDAVLKHFSALVLDELRKIDTGGRIGGEEFAILLSGADVAAATAFAERLRQKVVDTPAEFDGRNIPVTVSIGIAAVNAADTDANDAMTRADAALYRAKQSGRNRVELSA